MTKLTATFRNFESASSSTCCVCPEPLAFNFSRSPKLLFYVGDCFPRPFPWEDKLRCSSTYTVSIAVVHVQEFNQHTARNAIWWAAPSMVQRWQYVACMQQAYEGETSDTIKLISSSINFIELVGASDVTVVLISLGHTMRILSRANLYSVQCLAPLTQTACLFFYHEHGDCASSAETSVKGVTSYNTVTLTFTAWQMQLETVQVPPKRR